MESYVLTVCSTVDMPYQHMVDRKIPFVDFHYILDGKEYNDDLYQSITPEEFFTKIKNGAQPTTSQVSEGQFEEFWRPYLEKGQDILHLCLSSGITGVYGSACAARDSLKEEFPDRKILVVDSLCCATGYGLFTDYVADQRDAGKSIEEVYQWALDNRLRVHHWFYSTDLTSYKRGGRISAPAAFFATALGICPLMNVDDQGRLTPREKIIGRRKAARRALEMMVQYADNGTDYDGRCYICQSLCRDEAGKLKDMVEETFPKLKGKVLITDIGCTIGSHTGPGTISLFFLGQPRSN
jgi:DegV family protein with EDD domain